MNPNGKPTAEAILEAERAALEQQDMLPTPSLPELPPAPLAQPNPPGDPVPLTAEWFALQIAANEPIVQQHYNNWQQTLGGLNALRQMHALALQQQAALVSPQPPQV